VDLTTLEPVAIARQGIGRKFQKPTAVKTQQAQHLIQSIVLFTAQPGAQAGPHRFISLHIYDQSVDLTTLEPVAIARQGIGRKFQKPTVFEALTPTGHRSLCRSAAGFCR
jgi:ABC-type uncharacterized transport system ATPase subunit